MVLVCRMKWGTGILVAVVGAVAAFALLDAATAAMVVFTVVAAGFFGSLPWMIGGVLNRDRKKDRGSGAQVVKGFDQREE